MPRILAHRNRFGLAIAMLTSALVHTSPGRGDVYVIPHVVEQQGTTASSTYRFDHTVIAFYGSGLAGSPGSTGATIKLYLYDNTTGNPLQTFGVNVCNPCINPIGGLFPRKATIRIEDLINARGGFDTAVKLGFGVIVVEGDAGGVSLESNIINSHASAFDLSVLAVPPMRLRSEDPGAPHARMFQLAHVLEQEGNASTTTYVFDQTIFATYAAGLAGIPAGAGATLDLYLYDLTGDLPLRNQGTDVCNPCTFSLGGAHPRKRIIRIDDLILARGTFDAQVKLGSAILVVSGDAGKVTLEAVTTNAHTGPFDLTQYSPPLSPVHIAGALGVLLDPRPGLVAGLTARPTPASDAVRIAFELGKTAEVELSVYDVTGRQVATVFRGRLAAGPNELRWDGRGRFGRLQSGIYFARLSGEDGSSVARVVLMP